MVTRLILFLLVALGGAGLTLQVVWNARLRASTTSPVLTSIISVLVTLLSLALVWASSATERGALPAFNALPSWAWFGGVFAAVYLVVSLIALPKLGAAALFSLVIAGQFDAVWRERLPEDVLAGCFVKRACLEDIVYLPVLPNCDLPLVRGSRQYQYCPSWLVQGAAVRGLTSSTRS